MRIFAFRRTAALCMVAAAALSTPSIGTPSLHALGRRTRAPSYGVWPYSAERAPHCGRARASSFIATRSRQAGAAVSDGGPEQPDRKDEQKLQVARKLAKTLTGWIASKTGWAVRAVPPIRFISESTLAGRSDGLHLEAMYSDTEHTIYLPDRWNPEDLRDRSALLHELVHHLQYLNKIQATCRAEYEWDAYKLQVEWLREQGVETPFKLLGITPFTIYVLSHCPEF